MYFQYFFEVVTSTIFVTILASFCSLGVAEFASASSNQGNFSPCESLLSLSQQGVASRPFRVLPSKYLSLKFSDIRSWIDSDHVVEFRNERKQLSSVFAPQQKFWSLAKRFPDRFTQESIRAILRISKDRRISDRSLRPINLRPAVNSYATLKNISEFLPPSTSSHLVFSDEQPIFSEVALVLVRFKRTAVSKLEVLSMILSSGEETALDDMGNGLEILLDEISEMSDQAKVFDVIAVHSHPAAEMADDPFPARLSNPDFHNARELKGILAYRGLSKDLLSFFAVGEFAGDVFLGELP